MLKTVGKKMGLVDKELEQFKKCIMKVPILAQCLAAEKAKETSRTVAASAAPSAYTPLLSGEDEGQCSQEELYKEIKILNSEGDVPTRDLIACYRELHDNPEKFSNLNVQIKDSPNKKFYNKIRLLLDRLAVETQREQAKRNLQEEQKELEDSLEAEANVENPIETIASLKKLALFFEKNGDHDRVLPLYEAIFDKNRKLAEGYTREKDYYRALPLYEECLDISKRVLGEDDPETLKLLKDFVSIYNKIGGWVPMALLEELLAKQKRVLGEDDPETLNTLNNLALQNFFITRDYDRAKSLFEELLAKQKRILGDDHPDTLNTLINLASIEERRQKAVEKEKEKKKEEGTGASLGGKSKNKRNHKNKSFRSTRRRRRYSRARGGKKIAASSSKTIKRRRKNAR